MRKVMSGNYAAAYAAKLARVQVIPVYPITPQTSIVEKLSSFVANGELTAKMIDVESEHSAMAACISASSAGARTFTATSSQGLSLMHELLIWASGARLPIVMAEVSRALAPPWNVWADHLDVIAERDTGWIQMFCESNQEVLDTIIMLYRLCELEEIMLPSMAIMDAFILSHTLEPVSIPGQHVIDSFLPPYSPELAIDKGSPMLFGSVAKPDQYMEFRYKIERAMRTVPRRLEEIEKEYKKRLGRFYSGLLEPYQCDDADVILIANGSAVSTTRYVVNEMRKKGKKVGLLKLRSFRPFPADEIVKIIKNASAVGVLDRSYSFGHGGAIFTEVRGAAYGNVNSPKIKDYVTGIGGRDITPEVLHGIFEDLLTLKDKDGEIAW
ncbi:MAG: pyruvate ferredoxin oxidoreductase, partial [Thermoplasmata archaeon]|nr:pyruvate ferredoxin oxidoreductase [Thermoplasmata archaeon]